MGRLLFRLAWLGLTLLLGACSSTSVFVNYPSQANSYKAAIVHDAFAPALKQLESKKKTKDGLLYTQESGRLHQLNAQYEESLADFEAVYAAYQAIDDKAKINLSDIGANTSALLTNDNAIPYQGYGFERLFALQYQALNYLSLNNIEGAAVEMRRAALLQRRLEDDHAQELYQAQQEAEAKDIELNSWQNANELSATQHLASTVENSLQNAYAFYLSAVIFEALGERNHALVDYKKALALNPQNAQIRDDMQRLDNDRFLDKNSAHLVVFVEDGFVNERQSFDFPLPYFASGGQYITYFNIAFPYYSAGSPAANVTVFSGNHNLGSAQIISNVNAMAAKALVETIPAMIVRMVLRARAKYEIHKQSAQQAGILGSLFSTIYNLLSEQADRRNWLTLPANVQMLRAKMVEGEQTIVLNINGIQYPLTVTAINGRVTLLRVVYVGQRIYTQQFQL